MGFNYHTIIFEGDYIKNILIIEDDKPLSNGITLALKNGDNSLMQCFDITSARNMLNNHTYDLIILDINLPDGNGLDLLKEIKKHHQVPVIMLTANDLEMDIVTGLELGADDYITKPFSLAVLRARVNTQLRKQISQGIFMQDCFIFDFEKLEFFKNEELIELSKTEQKLLKILVDNKGLAIERNKLIDRIWSDGGYVEENALSVTIKRLRDKIEELPNKPKFIKTIYGIGYTWVVR